MKYFNYFDGALYINLESRLDRRESFEAKAFEAGLIIPRFNAIAFNPDEVAKNPNDPNWHKKVSSAASHQECIKLAKNSGWENCLIFEDDCIFIDNFMSKADACISDLKDREWDMFFFGGEPASQCNPITQNIVQTDGVYGAHAYAINSRFYDTVLSYPNDRNLIDVIYIHCSTHSKKFYLAKELLIWRDDDRYPSDLWIKSGSEKIYRDAYTKFVPNE
jgi:GR25 family glycosyltransferase involved in LPS biosynthesis